jgi:hypothetical protein
MQAFHGLVAEYAGLRINNWIRHSQRMLQDRKSSVLRLPMFCERNGLSLTVKAEIRTAAGLLADCRLVVAVQDKVVNTQIVAPTC